MGFSFYPFEKEKLLGLKGGNFNVIYIKIIDYKHFMPLDEKIKEWNDSLRNKGDSTNINLYLNVPYNNKTRKIFIKKSNTLIFED